MLQRKISRKQVATKEIYPFANSSYDVRILFEILERHWFAWDLSVATNKMKLKTRTPTRDTPKANRTIHFARKKSIRHRHTCCATRKQKHWRPMASSITSFDCFYGAIVCDLRFELKREQMDQIH